MPGHAHARMRMHCHTIPPTQAFWPALVVIALYEYLLFVVYCRLVSDTLSKYIAVPAYLLCIVYCRLDTNLLSRGKPAVLKLATAAFGANASWVTIATALQIQVNLNQALLPTQP